MDRGFGTPGGDQKSMISGPKIRKISEKCLKSFSVKCGPSENHPKIIFRWSGSYISEVSQVFFVKFWALLESFGQVQNKSQKFFIFFWKMTTRKTDPRKIMKKLLFGHSLNPGALGTVPGFKSAKFCSG